MARTCFAAYRRFPIFGPLRASIAIIQREKKILVIQRNDGRGVSLPGGIASRGEAEEVALRREVLEETGLSVVSAQLQVKYHSAAEVPCNISVYVAEVSGELRESWEGSPRWMSVEELEPQILKSQRQVVELMRKVVSGDQ